MRVEQIKLAIFIEGANLHSTAKALGFEIDYRRLLLEFRGRGTLLRAFYFAAIFEDQQYLPVRPLTDLLEYNGYTVITKPAKEFIDAKGNRKFKGSMDIEIAVSALDLAKHID